MSKTEAYLKCVQKEWPLTGPHWNKMETLTLPEAILIYYGIEPAPENPCLRGIGFEDFLLYGDEQKLWPVMQRSISDKSLLPLKNHLLQAQVFLSWLNEKGFTNSEIFNKYKLSETQPKKTFELHNAEDVKRIDFNTLSLPVLKCLGANLIVQAYRRKEKRKGNAIRISEAMQNNTLKKFFEDVSDPDKTPSLDTIRQYIEDQFQQAVE